MNLKDLSFRGQATLANCESEPIHVPGSIQPHGLLLGLDAAGTIRFASANTAIFFGHEPASVLGKTLASLHPAVYSLVAGPPRDGTDLGRPLSIEEAGRRWDVFGCTNADGVFLLELEAAVDIPIPMDALFDQTAQFVTHIERSRSLRELSQRVAEQTRAITGYDRVMVYRFDKDYNGEVYAEARDEAMEPFLNLHYPHTDIPVQARELYLRNVLRLIVDVNYEPVPLLALPDETEAAPDLGTARLRSVSPIHIQYLKNMGVGATLTISLISEGRLWGLIACHHRTAKHIGHLQRKAALLQGHFLASQIKVRQVAEEYEVHTVVEAHLQQLLNTVANEGDFAGRFESLSSLMAVANASGVALLHEGHLFEKGLTPPPERTRQLFQWLAESSGLQFVTEHLPAHYPDGAKIAAQASGILYHRLGDPQKEAIIWFREERERTINWAGNPHDAVKRSPVTNMLTPRTSFALYREQVRQHSLPWRTSEINAATRFAAALQNHFHLAYLKAEEANQRVLNEKLMKANEELANINWIATHDLKEPIRKILVFASRVMNEEGVHLSEGIQQSLSRIQVSAQRMRSLVEDLMAYRTLDDDTNPFAPVDLNELMKGVLDDFEEDLLDKEIRVLLEPLPVVPMIGYQARQLFTNLLGNAIKFSEHRQGGIIEIGCSLMAAGSFRHPTRTRTGDFYLIRIRDTGIGFDPIQNTRIFNIFYRLHDAGSIYKGTGIGLAICKRIVENHGGFITASGEAGQGATFSVYLPKEQE